MVQALKGSGIVIGVDMTVDEITRLVLLHNLEEGFESAVWKVGPISNTGGGSVGQKDIEPFVLPEGKAEL